ncbi:MAG TPA: SDR family oxidoreductase [Bacteroidota bacterium]|nr:SDR family oxidoreductase [Bacteroidota bacterium]
MNILLIGATGGTGRAILEQALERGHRVTALVRRPEKVTTKHERLTVVKGNVLEPVSLGKAMPGHDAVLSALGHKRWFVKTTILSEGTRNIIAAMERHGVKRFVCETALGIGDTRGRMGLYYTLFVIPVIIWFYFRDKELQEECIRKSTLDWIIVRPGRLTNGRKRGTYRHGASIGNWLWTVCISRASVADFMLMQLADDTYLRKSPVVAN